MRTDSPASCDLYFLYPGSGGWYEPVYGQPPGAGHTAGGWRQDRAGAYLPGQHGAGPGNFAALSVQYYQYSNRLSREPRWDFSYPPENRSGGRILGAGVAVAAALSLFFLFNLVRNGSAITDDIPTEIQITAHRGSSKSAPGEYHGGDGTGRGEYGRFCGDRCAGDGRRRGGSGP